MNDNGILYLYLFPDFKAVFRLFL